MATKLNRGDIIFACPTAEYAASFAEALTEFMNSAPGVIVPDAETGRNITLTHIPDDRAEELLAVWRAHFFAKGG